MLFERDCESHYPLLTTLTEWSHFFSEVLLIVSGYNTARDEARDGKFKNKLLSYGMPSDIAEHFIYNWSRWLKDYIYEQTGERVDYTSWWLQWNGGHSLYLVPLGR